MKNKNNSQRLLFFFDFSNPLKTNKEWIFWHKNSFKLVAKTLKKMRKFCSQKPWRTSSRDGYLHPLKNLPVVSQERSEMTFRSTARSTGTRYREQNSLPVDRPGRPGPFSESRALWRSTDPPAWLRARPVHVGRSDWSTDLCLGEPVRSTGRQPVQPL